MFASSPANSLKAARQLPGRPGMGGDHIIISLQQLGRSSADIMRHVRLKWRLPCRQAKPNFYASIQAQLVVP